MACGYQNKKGQVLFISDGISDGEFWATFTRQPNGSLKRFCSKLLPVRLSREQANKDLVIYARIMNLKKVEIPKEQSTCRF